MKGMQDGGILQPPATFPAMAIYQWGFALELPLLPFTREGSIHFEEARLRGIKAGSAGVMNRTYDRPAC